MVSARSKRELMYPRIKRELREFGWIFLYLALFLGALATYNMLLLNEFDIKFFRYGSALLNALVAAKVILIGEHLKLGHRHRNKPLLVCAVYKAFLFGMLLAIFHALEEVLKRLFHGQAAAGAFQELSLNTVLLRNLVVLCAFIPFFLLREMQRVMGEDAFASMMCGKPNIHHQERGTA